MRIWNVRHMRKNMGGKRGWPIALAACFYILFISLGSAGAGDTKPTGDGAIGGKAWCDLNEDGKRQKAEPLLPGIRVSLKGVRADGGYYYIASTETNARGRYKFKTLPLGTYAVLFDKNDLSFTVANVGNDKRDSDVTGTLHGGGLTDPVELTAHDPTNYSTDAGYVGCDTPEPPNKGVIGGLTWCDKNKDGIRQENEPILPGVCVTLKKVVNGHHEYVADVLTDAAGRYKFENLPLATYVVIWCDKDLAFTLSDVGDDCKDSDVVETSGDNGVSAQIVLTADHLTSLCTDAGYVGCAAPEPPKKGAVSGIAWCDVNQDGKRQEIELVLPNVGVTLKKVLDNGQQDVISTATTDAHGRYKFDKLPLGTYVVEFDDNGSSFTVADLADDCTDSDVTDHIGAIGVTDPIVLDAANLTSPCTDAGYIDDCAPTDGVISGKAWCDINADGNRQDSDTLLPDVCVTLNKVLDNGQYEVVDTTTTDAQGSYRFEQLPMGTYVVEWCDLDLSFTAQDAADDCRDSDVVEHTGGSGFTDRIVIDDDNPASTCTDAGYMGDCGPAPVLGSIGDRVWFDENANGLQDAGEEGVEGVRVNLQDANGTVIETTTTDANGNYLFDALDAGDYSVSFVEPDGFDFTTANVGANDNIDSDANVDTGMTRIISLGEGEHRRDVDAGLVKVTECIEIYFHGALNGDGGGKGTISYYPYYKSLRIGLHWLGSLFPDGTKLVDIDYAPLNQLVKDVFQVDVPNGPSRIIGRDTPTSYGGAPKTFSTYTYYDLNLNRDDYDLLDKFANALSRLELKVTMEVDGHQTDVYLCANAVPEVDTSISPIALDTDGSGAVERIAGAFVFDFTGNGQETKAAEWFAPTEGILVDTRIPGPMTGAHLFGDMGGKYADGYAKLATLDADGNGQVSGAELQGLALWTDANSNATLDDGELSALAAHRIVSLSTRHTGYVSTVILADGTTMVAEDLWFPVILPPPAAQPMASPGLINATAAGFGGAILLALLFLAVRRSRPGSAPGAA